MTKRTSKPVEPIDDVAVANYSLTYVDDLSFMETIGPVTHLCFSSRMTYAHHPEAKRRRVVQARLVVPTNQLVNIARQLLAGHVDEHAPVDDDGEPIGLQ